MNGWVFFRARPLANSRWDSVTVLSITQADDGYSLYLAVQVSKPSSKPWTQAAKVDCSGSRAVSEIHLQLSLPGPLRLYVDLVVDYCR